MECVRTHRTGWNKNEIFTVNLTSIIGMNGNLSLKKKNRLTTLNSYSQFSSVTVTGIVAEESVSVLTRPDPSNVNHHSPTVHLLSINRPLPFCTVWYCFNALNPCKLVLKLYQTVLNGDGCCQTIIDVGMKVNLRSSNQTLIGL